LLAYANAVGGKARRTRGARAKKSGIKHDQAGTSLPRREQHGARRLHGIK